MSTSKRQNAVMPNGIDNFYDLVTTRNNRGNPFLFVDKTMFIDKFLEIKDKVTLITRPRRFGKTLTLSMLQHFLAKEVNGKSTKGLFDGLQVSQYPSTMKKQGSAPVIFFDFQANKRSTF